MRIVIDLQGAQSESRFRGIGRFSLDFTHSFVKKATQNHEIFLLLNGALSESIEDIKERFKNILPEEKIKIFEIPTPTFEENTNNSPRARIAELIREYYITQLNPDFVLITSLFEGFVDNAVVSIGQLSNIRTAVILYDLIPYIDHKYLSNEIYKQFYMRKIEYLKKADVLLAISDSSKQEAINYLKFNESKIQTIYGAIDTIFQKVEFNGIDIEKIKNKFGIQNKFLMYTPGGFDYRKNFEKLIDAYSLLPENIKKEYQLVIVGKISEGNKLELENLSKQFGLEKSNLILTGYISDNDLIALYNLTDLFIFPSLHEGFGLPVLEAIGCGAVAIGSNTTSIPEVIGCKEALFDPNSAKSIAKKIEEVILDDKLRKKIYIQEQENKKKFSWDKSAERALGFLENQIKFTRQNFVSFDSFISKVVETIEKTYLENDDEIKKVSEVIYKNNKLVSTNITIKSIRIEGPFDSSYSLAILNREMAKALNKFFPGKVHLYSMEGYGDFEPNIDFLNKNRILYEMYENGKRIKNPDVVLRNLYPPRVCDAKGQVKLMNSYGWEESVFPESFVEEFNNYLTALPVMSEYVKKVMIDNGVFIPIFVVGDGVDHVLNVKEKVYKLKTKKIFKFLHISSCFPRKGVDILLKAYCNSFTNQDDVCLIIKTFPNPHNNIEDLIKKYAIGNNSPEIELINKDLEDEYIISLYKQSNCLVAPSRGEGFGLPMAEAMVFGLPVITTGYGGQIDFCTEETAWLINYSFKKAKTHMKLFDSYWVEPDWKHLAKVMLKAYKLPEKKVAIKTKRAKQFILDNYKWDDCANRLVNVIKEMLNNRTTFNWDKVKIGWVSTWEVKCGIATYSKHLIDHFTNKPIIFSTYNSLDERSVKCWNFSDDLNNLYYKILEHKIEIAVIQFNYGFFNFQSLKDLVIKLKNKNIKIILELHSTTDPAHEPSRKLTYLSEVLRLVERIIVHNIDDLNRLKELGLINNIMLFPLGVLDFEIDIKPQENLIATYGFFLPHKGLVETIKAIKILKDKGFNCKLKMINAKYPADISDKLIKEAEKLIKTQNLENDIELITEFLDDEVCLKEISKAKLVVFAYQETGESASAAVRYALAANRDILVTPLKIFDDVRECGFTLKGFTPEDIASGIIEYFNSNKKMLEEVKRYREKWLSAHRYSKLGRKYENVLKSICVNYKNF